MVGSADLVPIHNVACTRDPRISIKSSAEDSNVRPSPLAPCSAGQAKFSSLTGDSLKRVLCTAADSGQAASKHASTVARLSSID